MRLRLGVSMPEKGGRPAVVACQVEDLPADARGKVKQRFLVGHVERVQPPTVEGCADRVESLLRATAAEASCAIVDVGTAQGLALRQSLRGRTGAHRPHAYAGSARHVELFANFLEAYAEGRVQVAAGIQHGADLDRALVHYGGQRGQKDVELSSEDEALVIALCLSIYWPRHGGQAL